MLRVLMTTTVALGRIRWSHGLNYDRPMLEYKVIKFPPWLFSTMSNTAVGTEDTRAWQSLMETVTWLCLLIWRPWTILATEKKTVEWQLEIQWINIRSNSRSVDRLRWSHGLRYDLSMLEYKVDKFPPWLFSTISNTAVGREDTRAWQSPMETVTLILTLEATIVNNPSDRRS